MASFLTVQVQGLTRFISAPSGPTDALRLGDLSIALAPPIVLAGVSAFASGSSGRLDQQNAASLAMNARYKFTETGTGLTRIVRLVYGTQATAAPAVTRAADFDAATRPAVFILESPAGDDARLGGITQAAADARYAPLGAAGDFQPAITSVGDNASGSLEHVATATLTLPVLRTFRAGGYLQNWVLDAGTDANASDDYGPRIQRPNDYNASTNARVWTRWPSL